MASRCKYCAGLFLSDLVDLTQREFEGHSFPKVAYYQHHSCFDDLEQAANDGCDLCQLILDCFRGTPFKGEINWPEEWEGPQCNIDTSIYSETKYLDATDVKISINSEHVYSDEPLEKVRVLDNLLVQVGPRQGDAFNEETRDYDYDNEGFAKLRLVLTTSHGNNLNTTPP